MATHSASKSAKSAAASATETDAPQSTKRRNVPLPCKIEAFFMFSRVAWGYCTDYLPRFSADSPRFTEAFVQAQVDLVNTVELLPTLTARQAAASKAMEKLKAEGQAIKMQAQQLKTYIQYAYPDKALTNVELKAAGLAGYSSLDNNWSAISTMIKSVILYLGNNEAKLLEKENMPPNFKKDFEAGGKVFNEAWADHIAKEKASKDGTGTQDAGLLQILAELTPMLESGKRIFIFEPLTREKFTAAYLKKQVQGHHPAGVKGTVKWAETEKPLTNVKVWTMFTGEVKSAFTDLKGRYDLNLPAGTYDIHFEAEGTLPLLVEQRKVQPGVKGLLSVTLEPMLMPTPTALEDSPGAELPLADNFKLPDMNELEQSVKALTNGELVH